MTTKTKKFFQPLAIKAEKEMLDTPVYTVYTSEAFSTFLKNTKGEMRSIFEQTVKEDDSIFFYYLSYKSIEGDIPLLLVKEDFDSEYFYYELLRNFEEFSSNSSDKTIDLSEFRKRNQLTTKKEPISAIANKDFNFMKKTIDATLTDKLASIGFIDVELGDAIKKKGQVGEVTDFGSRRIKVFQTSFGSGTRLMSDLVTDISGSHYYNYSIEFSTQLSFEKKLEININIFLNHFGTRSTEKISHATKNTFFLGEVGESVRQYTLQKKNFFSEKEKKRIFENHGIPIDTNLIEKETLEALATGSFSIELNGETKTLFGGVLHSPISFGNTYNKFSNGASGIEKHSISKSIVNSLGYSLVDKIFDIRTVPSNSKKTKEKGFHFENMSFPKDVSLVPINVWCPNKSMYDFFLRYIDELLITGDIRKTSIEKIYNENYTITNNSGTFAIRFVHKSSVMGSYNISLAQPRENFNQNHFIDTVKSSLLSFGNSSNTESNIILLENFPNRWKTSVPKGKIAPVSSFENKEKRKEFEEQFIDPKDLIRKSFLESSKIPQFLDDSFIHFAHSSNFDELLSSHKTEVIDMEKGFKNRLLSAVLDNLSRIGFVTNDITNKDTLLAFKVAKKGKNNFFFAVKQEENKVSHFNFETSEWESDLVFQETYRNMRVQSKNSLAFKDQMAEKTLSLMKQVLSGFVSKPVVLFDAADRKNMYFIRSEYLDVPFLNRELLNKAKNICIYSKEAEVPYVVHLNDDERNIPIGTTLNTTVCKNVNEFFSHGMRADNMQSGLSQTKYVNATSLVTKQHTRGVLVLGENKEENFEVAQMVSNNRDLYIGYDYTLEKPYLFYIINRLSEYDI